MKKHEERIELAISQELRDALIFEAKRAYGDIKLEKAILNILEEWLAETELQPILDEEPYDEPAADALALPEDQKDFFEIATPAVEAGISDLDYEINWLHWNGNTVENVIKARAQVMHILEPKEYPALGKKIFDEILNAVKEQRETIYFDSFTGWQK